MVSEAWNGRLKTKKKRAKMLCPRLKRGETCWVKSRHENQVVPTSKSELTWQWQVKGKPGVAVLSPGWGPHSVSVTASADLSG